MSTVQLLYDGRLVARPSIVSLDSEFMHVEVGAVTDRGSDLNGALPASSIGH